MPVAVIVSSSFDEPTTSTVRDHLRDSGVEVVQFDADRVARGEQIFSAYLRGDELLLRFDDGEIRQSDIGCAWWRKPHWIWLKHEDMLTGRSIERDANRVQQAAFSLVPDDAWLNSPDAIRAASHLHRQLSAASRVGFRTPDTLVTNDWSETERLSGADALAIKALTGLIEREGDRARTVFTSRIDAESLDEFRSRANPYPAVIQPFVDADREWRVTVVGSEIFAAAIHTSEAASNDWREHQLTDEVEFALGDLPKEIEGRCVEVTRQLGLSFAAIDLIEAQSEFWFLEANPNGQFAWLDQQLSLGIGKAVARAMTTKMKARGNLNENHR